MAPYLTASDLAGIYRVSLETIYRWASQDNWRTKTTRPRKYHLEDAQASYDRRRKPGARNAQTLRSLLIRTTSARAGAQPTGRRGNLSSLKPVPVATGENSL
jgi:hypothetical protein